MKKEFSNAENFLHLYQDFARKGQKYQLKLLQSFTPLLFAN